MELRRLGDASVTEAYAALFERLLLSPEWLKRYLRLPSGTARDAVRLAAFQALAVLRRHCAKLSYELSLSRDGPSAERAEEYADGPAARALRRAAPGLLPLRRGPPAVLGALPAGVGAGGAAHAPGSRSASTRTSGATPPPAPGCRALFARGAPTTRRRSPRSYRRTGSRCPRREPASWPYSTDERRSGAAPGLLLLAQRADDLVLRRVAGRLARWAAAAALGLAAVLRLAGARAHRLHQLHLDDEQLVGRAPRCRPRRGEAAPSCWERRRRGACAAPSPPRTSGSRLLQRRLDLLRRHRCYCRPCAPSPLP